MLELLDNLECFYIKKINDKYNKLCIKITIIKNK